MNENYVVHYQSKKSINSPQIEAKCQKKTVNGPSGDITNDEISFGIVFEEVNNENTNHTTHEIN